MAGTKTNERPGTRAQVRFVRTSAYKARVVLDLIRGEPVSRALELLDFVERDVAEVIRKCLESAIANAEHNDGQTADELFVASCYADEGPTLKRWRPRARGRATRIRKRTCHITIIVARMSPEQLDRLRQQTVGGGGANRAAAEARRRRVAKSRQEKAEAAAAAIDEADEHDHDHADDDAETVASEAVPDADQDQADDEAADEAADTATSETAAEASDDTDDEKGAS
ncbi:MAG: 50S ribosomal protein L22 [Acidimicrobiia bacterium]|nr:50S ribosomal protein L22 [Acidimicrobiia bacterium]